MSSIPTFLRSFKTRRFFFSTYNSECFFQGLSLYLTLSYEKPSFVILSLLKIISILFQRHVKLIRPPFLRKQKKLSRQDALATAEIARARVTLRG